jgi:hypothetical protein
MTWDMGNLQSVTSLVTTNHVEEKKAVMTNNTTPNLNLYNRKRRQTAASLNYDIKVTEL